MDIWYVHGAGASERSFKWLCEQLPKHTPKFLVYALGEPVLSVSERLRQQLNGKPSILLGHSFGGIVAAIAANHPNVNKIITLCAPFGGIPYAEVISFFNHHPLFSDLKANGLALKTARTQSLEKPHLAIVATRGLPTPFITESNDGIITVASQMARKVPCELLPLNHFEVLLSHEVVNLITPFIKS